MIKEYAIDPELLNSWKDFRFFITFFSLENGRAISGYPEPQKWKDLVINAAREALKANSKKDEINAREKNDAHQMDIKKIENCLEKIRLIDRFRFNNWNDELDWLNNIIEEDKRKPFQAIISNKIAGCPKVISGDDVCLQLPPEIMGLLESPRSVMVNRKAKEMALSIKEFLQSSKQLIFIDPYFFAKPTDTKQAKNKRDILRYTRPLTAFLELIHKENKYNSSRVTRLQYHSKNDDYCSPDHIFKSICMEKLPSVIPTGLDLELIRWENENLHNRYVLTDIGGVMFGTGLDDNEENNSNSTDTDIVTLLDENTRKQLWKQYVSANKVPVLKVIGKA